MIEIWKTTSVSACDCLLGWTLHLPRDLALLMVAVVSALLAIVLRRCAANQELLRLAKQDECQLKELIRQARQAGDRPLVRRYRRTRAAVAWIRFTQELRALAVTILPLALLITWATSRMPYLPPQANEPVKLVAWLPASAVEQVLHVVPEEGIDAETGWIQLVQNVEKDGRPRGMAEWTFSCQARPTDYALKIRFRDHVVEHPLGVGHATYLPGRRTHDCGLETELHYRPYRPLGITSGKILGLQPWLVAYLAIALLAFCFCKRVSGTV